MPDFNLMRELRRKADSKIVLLVLDGLGGLPLKPGGPTELEAARTPHLDRLASEGTLGQTIPIRHGITPGSGPAHLGLFGYDPLEYVVGRGVLEGVGVGIVVKKGEVAARGNFCTVDAEGRITDRRAGRIASSEAIPLVARLAQVKVPGVEVEVRHVQEYRFAVVMRGPGLEPHLADTDPQRTGVAPLPARATQPGAEATADLFNRWIAEARKVIADHPKANALTLRGFSTDPELPRFPEVFGVRSACVAVYPMYKGVAELVGMSVLKVEGDRPEDEFAALAKAWNDFDFFFVHIKKTDSRGEDGDFAAKSAVIESVDSALPKLLELGPSVLAVTGDHSTPAKLKTHSWHPVPFLLWAPATVRTDDQTQFGESTCARGGLGTILATDAMPLMLAHALRLEKFGA
ncbi:MAG: 2,3-bisphosphoglycerate-independent phosphoglycerate mutase [Chloroflexi bacterium]|nr:2,3-bisphosphoglycerate-independent phosphoglycerate mutase [Chloroflexota bacterium]